MTDLTQAKSILSKNQDKSYPIPDGTECPFCGSPKPHWIWKLWNVDGYDPEMKKVTCAACNSRWWEAPPPKSSRDMRWEDE